MWREAALNARDTSSFVRAAKVGETINIRSQVVGQGQQRLLCPIDAALTTSLHAGKTLAYTRVDIENAQSGKLLAFGQSSSLRTETERLVLTIAQEHTPSLYRKHSRVPRMSNLVMMEKR